MSVSFFVSIPRILGATSPRVNPLTLVNCSISRVVGSVRATLTNGAKHWLASGYPLPTISGYAYESNFGIARTQMRAGTTRQRRRWYNGYGKMEVSLELPIELLSKFEYDMSAYGYEWFGMPLVTGANLSDRVESHTVRIVAKPTFGEIFGDTIKVTLQLDYVINKRASVLTVSDEGAKASQTGGSIHEGTYTQTFFYTSISAVDTFPGSAGPKQAYMEIVKATQGPGTIHEGQVDTNLTMTKQTSGSIYQGTYVLG